MLPLVVAILFMAVSVSLPWMTASHYVDAGGKKEVADSWTFYLWGQTYTVVGTKVIQSVTDVYDYRDFPFYGMVTISLALILSIITFLSGRGTVLHVRGRQFKLGYNINPVYVLLASALLIYFTWVYIPAASEGVRAVLERKDYVSEFGPSLDFLFGALLSTAVTIAMTVLKSREEKNEEKSESGGERIPTI